MHFDISNCFKLQDVSEDTLLIAYIPLGRCMYLCRGRLSELTVCMPTWDLVQGSMTHDQKLSDLNLQKKVLMLQPNCKASKIFTDHSLSTPPFLTLAIPKSKTPSYSNSSFSSLSWMSIPNTFWLLVNWNDVSREYTRGTGWFDCWKAMGTSNLK